MSRVIFVDGTSSTGATTLCRAIIRRLPEFFLYIPNDAFLNGIHKRKWPLDSEGIPIPLMKTAIGMFRCLGTLADSGIDLVVDTMLAHESWMQESAAALGDHDSLLVRLHCSPDELEKRERARGNRPVGLALWQASTFYKCPDHDLMIDTTRRSPEECADEIIGAMSTHAHPRALARLRTI